MPRIQRSNLPRALFAHLLDRIKTRPKLNRSEARGKFVSTRVSPPEYKEIVEAVRKSGLPKTQWVRRVLLLEARKG